MKKVLIISGSIILCLLAALAIVVAVADVEGGKNGITLVFKSADASAEYDGTALVAPEWELTSGALEKGHVAKVSVTGSQTEAGEGKNTLSVTILNDDGDDVTDRYNIKLNEGTLSVYKKNVEFVAKSLQKTYDGTPLKCNEYEIISGGILADHRAVATYSGELIEAGTVEVRASLSIFDESGNDVSGNYNLVSHPGTLTVVKRRLSLKSATVERVYNGVPLSNDKISIIEGSLAPEHDMVSQTSARLTGVGEVSNKFTVAIRDFSGKDVTDNYNIEYNFGTLRVLASKITVYTGSDAKVYDGEEFACDTFGISSGSIATGESLDAVFSTVARNVGIYENKATFSVISAAGIDTTQNYIITVVTGTVEILERSLILSSSDDSKIYDGQPLTNEEITYLEGTTLAEGHTLSAIFTGSQETQGTSKNEFSAVVYDENGEDVSSNYDIKTFFGELTVTKAAIAVRSPDKTKGYDGTALFSTEDDMIVMGTVLPGHRMEFDITGNRISAGVSDNSFDVKIYAEDGTDVTDNYDIVKNYGKLTVTKRSLIITTPTIDVLYDAKEKFSLPEDCTVDGELAPGDELILVLPQKHASVYKGKNTVVVMIERGGVDVSENYDLTVVEGDFTIHPVTLSIGTETRHKVYDKTALLAPNSPGWFYLSDARPVEGHVLGVPEFVSSIREVGSMQNKVVMEIYDSITGENVTRNYNIEYTYGSLIVTPFNITIRSGSAEKDYDGVPLTHDYWEIISTSANSEIPAGDVLEVIVCGERLSVGESPNDFAVDVIDENGQSVLSNYNITMLEGSLVVNGDDPEENEPEETEPVTVMKIRSTSSGRVYLRYMSYSDTSGKLEAKPYDGMINSKYSYNYLASASVKNAVNAELIEIENYMVNMYVLPAYPVMEEKNYPLPTNDVIYSNKHDGTYSLLYYHYSGYGDELGPVPSEYSDEEKAYRDFVYKNYTDVGDNETLRYMNKIIDKYQFSKDDRDIVTTVASYIQNAAKYDLSVAERLDKEEDMIIQFLETYKRGVCRHYAAAATAMYRALGIPARYTVGFAAEAVEDKWVNVTTAEAHAWVEVYFDGIGWLAIEVTGGNGSGNNPDGDDSDDTDTPKNNELKLKPVTEHYIYNGSVIKHSGSIQGFTDWANKGYTLDAVVSGESSEVGWTHVYIDKVTIYDPDGNDVTNKFKITRSAGRMQIYLYTVTVSSGGTTQEYNGGELTNSNYSIELGPNQNLAHNVEVECTGSITDVGKTRNTFNVTITDEKGLDITDQYYVSKKYGILEVYARELNIIVNDAKKTYDGTPLQSTAYSIPDLSQIVSGQFLDDIVITGSQTNVGVSENHLTNIRVYMVVGDMFVDVTNNYTIISTPGKLWVEP